MSRIRCRLAFVVVVVAALSGCSSCGSPKPGGEGEGEGEGASGGDPALARELCQVWTRGELEFTVAVIDGFATPARCQAAELPKLNPSDADQAAQQSCANDGDAVFSAFDVALKHGNVTFHKDAIDACSAVDFTDPNAVNAPTLPASCDASALFTANLKQGDACLQDWDCPSGTHCEAKDLTKQELACLAPAQAGEACAGPASGLVPTPGDPLDGRRCDATLDCVQNVCTARAQLGDDCTNASCDATLRCDATSKKCVAKIATGASGCSASADCSDANATCSPAGACVVPVADGAACNVATDVCKSSCSTCRPTTAGGTTTQCLDRAGKGEPCASNDDCVHNFVCDTTTTHACVEGGAAGATCGADADCKDGFVCASNSQCTQQPDIGQACGQATTTECKSGQCNGTICVAGNVGDACNADQACANGNLCARANHQCAAAPSTGPCSTDSACADGALCDDSDAANPVCKPIPKVGDACVGSQKTCDAGQFCDGNNTCQATKDAGSTCSDGTECKSTVCDNGTCTTVGPSCATSKDFFPLFVVLSICLPVSRRMRSLRSPRSPRSR